MYVAFGIGRYYANHELTHARNRMADYVGRLLPRRQVVVKGPRSLEVTVWRQATPERLIIHLANRTPLAHDMPRIQEVLPLRDVEIEFASPYAEPRVSCRGAEGVVSVDGGRVRVRLSEMLEYAAVVVEGR
jgi:hypothetical protein